MSRDPFLLKRKQTFFHSYISVREIILNSELLVIIEPVNYCDTCGKYEDVIDQ